MAKVSLALLLERVEDKGKADLGHVVGRLQAADGRDPGLPLAHVDRLLADAQAQAGEEDDGLRLRVVGGVGVEQALQRPPAVGAKAGGAIGYPAAAEDGAEPRENQVADPPRPASFVGRTAEEAGADDHVPASLEDEAGPAVGVGRGGPA